MKRLIGVAIAFTLATASAFAQVQVSGQVRAGGELLIIHSDEDTDPQTARLGESARIDFRVGNDREAGDVGGLIRLQANGGFSRAYAWWRPHNMVRLQFGQNSDGDWGTAGFNGWSFTGDAMDLGVARRATPDMRNSHAIGFYGGMNMQSILLSLYPIDGLTVNFGLPLAGPIFNNDRISRADDAWKRVQAQVVYNISDIGSVRLTYMGGRGIAGSFNEDGTFNASGIGGRNAPREYFAEGGVFYLSFWSGGTLVNGLDLNIGLSYEIPVEEEQGDVTVTFQDPMEIGFGARYTSGAFGVSFRTAVSLIGSIKSEWTGGSDEWKMPVRLGFTLLPNYNLGSMRVFCQLGLELDIPDEGDTGIEWMVNPYVRIPVGGLQFFGGFSIEGWDRGGDNDGVNFRIPLGVVFTL